MFTMTGHTGTGGKQCNVYNDWHTGPGGKQCNVYNDWAHRDWRETM